jgi:hypothetical protein
MTARLAPSGEDFAALRGLAEQVAAAIDRKDAALYLAAFDPAAALTRTRGGTVISRTPAEEWEAGPSTMHPSVHTLHTICNSRFEVDGEEARGEIYCVAYNFAPEGLPPGYHLAVPPSIPEGSVLRSAYARFEDRYEKQHGRWVIVERRTHTEGVEVRALSAPA